MTIFATITEPEVRDLVMAALSDKGISIVDGSLVPKCTQQHDERPEFEGYTFTMIIKEKGKPTK